ncbi:hypothetical protein SAMN05443287_102689 [Micromonospora phaseoli]|uniref:Uncharacterized protein n=1 Tax=Micromonospora phaseoli TaxID=1144548 RepID=A0A1H6VJP9_9ACTN|nr:hypothetical protein [Micromonospora phaseoli]PZV93558.1 hypothetical protein CLV64_10917 [Micromonospora phaseoli]GIJ80188.1 hypothetical protein Xph01_46200 [Micromonospora phaseoli]SEJ03886.1 hypothetical protein SAMN05443287_102689 [Micromonospora phaseoli]
MSLPTPDPHSAGKLRWASAEVIAGIEQQVQPQVSLPSRIGQAAVAAVVFTWPPAFVVFAAATVAVPAVTNDASVGTTALWALKFAILIAITAMVTPLRRRSGRPATADATKPYVAELDPPAHRTMLRLVIHALVSGAGAWLVLALQGLSVSQIAPLTVLLVVVLHLLPLIVARLLQRRRRS